jgi:glutamyl-tRNA reductase
VQICARRSESSRRERARAAEAAVGDGGGEVYEALVSQRTRQIAALHRELAAIERETSSTDDLRTLTPETLRGLIAEMDPARVVRSLVDRVVLEPFPDMSNSTARPLV